MKLIAFEQRDFDGLYSFMQPLWHETYGGFLSKEHIDRLLDCYFSPIALKRYKSLGYEYYKLDNVGVLVFVDRGDYVYMDKLYLLPQARGKGYPAFAFEQMAKRGKDIMLSANRQNARALKCYQKNGFVIVEEKEIDFGNGMINYDYILRKTITK